MPRLTMSLLGSFQVELDGEPVIHFRAANNQGLLVYLALHAGTSLSREVLATLFWPEESSEKAYNNLRQAVYRLRKLLGDREQPRQPFLQATRQTVAFNPHSDYTLDAATFLQAVAGGDLETAVAAYQGDLLPGFTCDSLPFEDWLRQEREQMHRLALATMGELAQEYLENGRYDEAQAIIRRQLSLEPWRESAHRQLMLAYALTGERASALAQYEQCREQLWEELGVMPDAETTNLVEEIKAGRYGPAAQQASMLAPPRTRHYLPAVSTPLIGRELELSYIIDLLGEQQQRLVTIVGPGGMGKTRLALAAGGELLDLYGDDFYKDGVYFIDLAPLSHPDEIVPALGAALAYQAPEEIDDVYAHLLSTLSQRRLLLILDNFEHLMAGTDLVNDILRTCPKVAILVTSRQRLNLASENRYELGGLTYPDSPGTDDAKSFTAVQLFVDSGRRVQPHSSLAEENMADVLRICRLVQGMPLALVLAASWLELLSPEEIADEIENSQHFLAADLADLPRRQRSMQAVFERSWEMLAEDEKRALANLTVFRGGFSRQAARQVAEANLRLLQSLVTKSLLHHQAETSRFSMHELLRQFASAYQEAYELDNPVRQAHCRTYARLVEEESRRGLGFWPIQLPRKLAADRDNISRAWDYAVEHGLAAELSAMARGMAMFSMNQGIKPEEEFKQAIHALQQHGYADSHPALLHLRFVALKIRFGHEEYSAVEEDYVEFLPRLMEQKNPELRFWAYNQMAHYYNELYETRALVMTEKATQAALETGDVLLIMLAESEEVWIQIDQGQLSEQALPRLQEMLDSIEVDYADSFAAYGLLRSLGLHCLSAKAYDEATGYAVRSLNIAKGWQDLFWMSIAVDVLVTVYEELAQPERVGSLYLDMLEWHLAIGQVWQTLGFIWARSELSAQLIGGTETAVSLMSMVYHHPEAVPFHQQMIEESQERLEEELGAEVYAAAWERGKELDFDTAVVQIQVALAYN